MTALLHTGHSRLKAWLTKKGRKPPLGDHGWISSPERRETAISGHCPIVSERLLQTEAVIQRPLTIGSHRPTRAIHGVRRGIGHETHSGHCRQRRGRALLAGSGYWFSPDAVTHAPAFLVDFGGRY